MIAEREGPDLIVLDMMMPKKSGFLVLEKLKGRPGGLIPTIMITGNEGSRHRAYAEMLGVRDYIRKPFRDGKARQVGREGSRRALRARTGRRPRLTPGGSASSDHGIGYPSPLRIVVSAINGRPVTAEWSLESIRSKRAIPRASSL